MTSTVDMGACGDGGTNLKSRKTQTRLSMKWTAAEVATSGVEVEPANEDPTSIAPILRTHLDPPSPSEFKPPSCTTRLSHRIRKFLNLHWTPDMLEGAEEETEKRREKERAKTQRQRERAIQHHDDKIRYNCEKQRLLQLDTEKRRKASRQIARSGRVRVIKMTTPTPDSLMC